MRSWDKINSTSARLTLFTGRTLNRLRPDMLEKMGGRLSLHTERVLTGVYEYVGAESGFKSDMLTGR